MVGFKELTLGGFQGINPWSHSLWKYYKELTLSNSLGLKIEYFCLPNLVLTYVIIRIWNSTFYVINKELALDRAQGINPWISFKELTLEMLWFMSLYLSDLINNKQKNVIHYTHIPKLRKNVIEQDFFFVFLITGRALHGSDQPFRF